MLLYIPIHRPIHKVSNVVELILLADLEGQPMLRVSLPPSCQPWQKKLRKSGNDYAQSQPCVNQERLKKCPIGNLNRFNQNRFRLKRLIPIEHDLKLRTLSNTPVSQNTLTTTYVLELQI